MRVMEKIITSDERRSDDWLASDICHFANIQILLLAIGTTVIRVTLIHYHKPRFQKSYLASVIYLKYI